jgi:hypothetical protein
VAAGRAPLVYRPRSLPDARRFAFAADVGWVPPTARHSTEPPLVGLVQRHGFDVSEHWLR